MSKRLHSNGQSSVVPKKRAKERRKELEESDEDANVSQRPDFSLNQVRHIFNKTFILT